ncbi:MAG: glycosyltransferase [Bacteroidetes bacterium]|nr:glycosyltransferase [Bacteroidota bacterium]MDA1116385.1 glycosyltransferase [Bacteroidota bacterium]
MIKTLVISAMLPPYHHGGAEKMGQLFVDELVHRGFNPLVLTHKASRQGSYLFLPVLLGNVCSPKKITQQGRFVKLIYHLLDLFNPILLLELIYWFTTKKVKVIYAHNITYFGFNIMIAARICNIKFVQITHDYYYTCVKSSRFTAGRNCSKNCTSCAIFKAPIKLLSHSVEAVFVSKALQDSITTDVKFRTAQVIYNPKQDANSSDTVHSETNPTFTFGYLGAISENKGIVQFLKRHVDLLESMGVNILIAGSGEGQYYEDFLTLVNSNPAVTYVGQTVPEEFFPKIKFLLVPSVWNEPLATVILEALAYGIPAIANHTGGSSEMIDQGQTGFYFDLFDQSSAQDQLKRIVELSNSDYEALQKNINAKPWPTKASWIESILKI